MAGEYRGRGPRAQAAREEGSPPTLTVNGYSEEWLGKGFPWVYADEIEAKSGSPQPGQLVHLRSRKGAPLGVGLWDEGRVAVRRFRRDNGPIDGELLAERLRLARARRPLPPRTTAWRWVHGESDDLPGIRVNVWGEEASIVLDSPGLRVLAEPLCAAILEQQGFERVWLSWRPHSADAELLAPEEVRQLHGPPPVGTVWVEELGLKVGVRPQDGADVGLFCDMRDIRAWLAPHWAGRRVLNTFAHTGMFSLCAAHHGAAEVMTVDLSPAYLERAAENLRANGLDPAAHTFWAEDSFKALDALRRKNRLFDLVIVDPPSFSHGPQGTFSVMRDLGRLTAAALRVLAPGGWLLLACNHGKLSPKEFSKQILDGATRAGQSLRLVHSGSTPVDFPAALDFPESRYLKVWILAS